MKKLLLMLLFPLGAFAQTDTATNLLPYKEGKVVYEQVSEVPGLNKSEIYGAAKKWMSDVFKNSNAVIQSENEPTGQIVGKGSVTISHFNKAAIFGTVLDLNFSIQIDCKDEKYRIRFYDIINKKILSSYNIDASSAIEAMDAGYRRKKNQQKWNDMVVITNQRFYGLIEDSKQSILKSKSDTF